MQFPKFETLVYRRLSDRWTCQCIRNIDTNQGFGCGTAHLPKERRPTTCILASPFHLFLTTTHYKDTVSILACSCPHLEHRVRRNSQHLRRCRNFFLDSHRLPKRFFYIACWKPDLIEWKFIHEHLLVNEYQVFHPRPLSAPARGRYTGNR
jgi:hypothetical protein